jgi:hypothetical protein
VEPNPTPSVTLCHPVWPAQWCRAHRCTWAPASQSATSPWSELRRPSLRRVLACGVDLLRVGRARLEPATEGGNDEGEEGRSRARQGGARAGEDGAAPKAGAANLGRHAVESGGAGPEKGEERKKEREWVTVSTVKWTHGAFLQKPHCRNWSTRRRIFFYQGAFIQKKNHTVWTGQYPPRQRKQRCTISQ